MVEEFTLPVRKGSGEFTSARVKPASTAARRSGEWSTAAGRRIFVPLVKSGKNCEFGIANSSRPVELFLQFAIPNSQFAIRNSLKIRKNEVGHHLPHMLHQHGICNPMARLRINHQLDLLPRFLQFVKKLNSICHMHVVIDGAMDQKQFAM